VKKVMSGKFLSYFLKENYVIFKVAFFEETLKMPQLKIKSGVM